jgi:hypothetical protein
VGVGFVDLAGPYAAVGGLRRLSPPTEAIEVGEYRHDSRWKTVPNQRLQAPSRAVVALPQNLMHPLPRKSISSVPKLANRTPFAFVIDSFLVRTANYAIGHCDGSNLMLLEKFKYLACNVRIGADVATIHSPVT